GILLVSAASVNTGRSITTSTPFCRSDDSTLCVTLAVFARGLSLPIQATHLAIHIFARGPDYVPISLAVMGILTTRGWRHSMHCFRVQRTPTQSVSSVLRIP